MQKKTVYVETSIVSFLTSRPTKDVLSSAWQQITKNWWQTQRERFVLYASDVVRDEAARGDVAASARRLEILLQLPTLLISESVINLSKDLIIRGALPDKAADDAFHVAISAVHGMDYLLTWNCRHIDNAEVKPLMRAICGAHGFVCPEICTPQELMGIDNDGR